MTVSSRSGKYFRLLNLLVNITVSGISVRTILMGNSYSEYRLQLNETVHFVTSSFDLEGDLSDAYDIPAGSNVGADMLTDSGRVFMLPGEMP